jgi:hypothetical protein
MQRVVVSVSVSFIVTCEKRATQSSVLGGVPIRQHSTADHRSRLITPTLAQYHATASREESDSSSTHHREISPLPALSLRSCLVLSSLSFCLSVGLSTSSIH